MSIRPDPATSRRPIKPALSGVAVGTLWGAWNVPPHVGAESLLQFIPMVLAVAIAAGGVLALVTEGVALAVTLIRSAPRRKASTGQRMVA
jgi:hypothetical protein